MRHSPVDHNRTARRYAERNPGLLVVCAAMLAFVVCVANFALGHAHAGVTSAIVALLGFGAGLAWLAMDGRRTRQAERDWAIRHPAPR